MYMEDGIASKPCESRRWIEYYHYTTFNERNVITFSVNITEKVLY